MGYPEFPPYDHGGTLTVREDGLWSELTASVAKDNPALATMGGRLAALSTWIDAHNADRHPEAQLWGRVAKVGEEHGEVIEALIAATGQNPRKPQDPAAMGRVVKELLDTALTALAAAEHLTGNTGKSVVMLADHVGRVHTRAGLDTPPE